MEGQPSYLEIAVGLLKAEVSTSDVMGVAAAKLLEQSHLDFAEGDQDMADRLDEVAGKIGEYLNDLDPEISNGLLTDVAFAMREYQATVGSDSKQVQPPSTQQPAEAAADIAAGAETKPRRLKPIAKEDLPAFPVVDKSEWPTATNPEILGWYLLGVLDEVELQVIPPQEVVDWLERLCQDQTSLALKALNAHNPALPARLGRLIELAAESDGGNGLSDSILQLCQQLELVHNPPEVEVVPEEPLEEFSLAEIASLDPKEVLPDMDEDLANIAQAWANLLMNNPGEYFSYQEVSSALAHELQADEQTILGIISGKQHQHKQLRSVIRSLSGVMVNSIKDKEKGVTTLKVAYWPGLDDFTSRIDGCMVARDTFDDRIPGYATLLDDTKGLIAASIECIINSPGTVYTIDSLAMMTSVRRLGFVSSAISRLLSNKQFFSALKDVMGIDVGFEADGSIAFGLGVADLIDASDQSQADPLGDASDPLEWAKFAECRDANTNTFFPERGDYLAVEEARIICSRCPVKNECLEYAVALRIKEGIWGGQSERQRRRLRKTRELASWVTD